MRTMRNIMHAVVPEERANVDISIASMDEGQSGWTVPWAMFHDSQRKFWLNGAYTLNDSPGGTVQMHVRRDPDGWHVDCTSCRNHRWGESGYIDSFPK